MTFALKNGVLFGGTTSKISMSSKVRYAGKIGGGLGIDAGDTGTIKVAVDGIHAKLRLVYKDRAAAAFSTCDG